MFIIIYFLLIDSYKLIELYVQSKNQMIPLYKVLSRLHFFFKKKIDNISLVCYLMKPITNSISILITSWAIVWYMFECYCVELK